jgi:hypothetical protein
VGRANVPNRWGQSDLDYLAVGQNDGTIIRRLRDLSNSNKAASESFARGQGNPVKKLEKCACNSQFQHLNVEQNQWVLRDGGGLGHFT